ncbi:MerR family transcriptional regulator [Clostridioides sp. ZZV14-6044]|uniref:MerR family transcriptional regulator n=1 Tax=Clostridioides sp. ZZV14-6044 TaxID=2811488 RepID=UPI001D1276CD|nr:MerR family transcriptional regulator [Clostridioides sp. ZZV14-6044]
MTYKPEEFANIIGVTVRTLKNWDKNGKLKAFRTVTNRMYYTEEHYMKCMGEDEKYIIAFNCKSEEKRQSIRDYARFIGCEEI